VTEIDPRILRVGLEVSGSIRWYESPLAIRVRGSKLANDAQNQCDIAISNLSRDVRNYAGFSWGRSRRPPPRLRPKSGWK